MGADWVMAQIFYGSDWSDPLSLSAKQLPHAYRNSLTKACDLWCNLRNRNQKRKEKCRGILDLPLSWLDFLVFVPLLLIFWFLLLCSWFLLGKFFWGFIWVLTWGICGEIFGGDGENEFFFFKECGEFAVRFFFFFFKVWGRNTMGDESFKNVRENKWWEKKKGATAEEKRIRCGWNITRVIQTLKAMAWTRELLAGPTT